MQQTKTYTSVLFRPEVIREAHETFNNKLDQEIVDLDLFTRTLKLVTTNGVSRSFDTEEEFFAEYRAAPLSFSYDADWSEAGFDVRGSIDTKKRTTKTSVTVKLPRRADVDAVFDVFERNLDKARLPVILPKVFIGHGRSPQWRDLRDHLQDQHDIEVVAYEVEPRAGRNIRDILETMLAEPPRVHRRLGLLSPAVGAGFFSSL